MRRVGTARPHLMARAIALPIRVYRRVLSPLLPARCRFAPTCSAYALGALHDHGALRGGWLTLRRLVRCQPFHPGGWDPVPPVRDADRQESGRQESGRLEPVSSGVRS